MKCHLVVPDLFLPAEVAAEACAGLELPALEWLLARSQQQPLSAGSLEEWLCDSFGVSNQAIAPVTLLADGMLPGDAYWLRADPVHVRMQREQMILQPDVALTADEARQLCASLNAHFAAEGLHFFAPHPNRWYLQLDVAPDMMTRPLAQAAGRNVHAHLPHGHDALRWHGAFNEIQMLFFEHAVNQAREARGELPVNSVWLWGGGYAQKELERKFSWVASDSSLAASFAQAAGIPHVPLPNGMNGFSGAAHDNVLIVWEGLRSSLQQGDLHGWRDSVMRLEQECAVVLRDALGTGRISQLSLDVPEKGGARRFVLTSSAMWRLWRLPKSLALYAKAQGA